MSRQPKDRARSSAGSAGAIESGGRQGETGPQARSARRKGGEGPLRGNYPRDLVGYGKRPPDPKWPGGARLALQIVMNYEEGGERSILHGDKEAEAYLQEVVGLPALQGVRNLQVESMYEYGSRVGFWRLMRTFASYGIKISIFAVAMALERHPEAAAAIVEAGHEVVSHGWKWIDYQFVSEKVERDHMRLMGRPGRAAALARFFDYVERHDRVWVCRRIDIARHWIEQHPYRPGTT